MRYLSVLGAYGTAVLYRKKDDDSLVILKEINLHDLNASERQLAMNEVQRQGPVLCDALSDLLSTVTLWSMLCAWFCEVLRQWMALRALQVRVLAMFDHPNIISYYDSFEEDGLMMIEMEYADGG